MLAKFCFRNSAEGVMCLRSSAFTTPLKRKYVTIFTAVNSALGEKTLLTSTSAILHMGNVFAKFCNSALGVSLPEVPFPKLRCRGNVFAKFPSSR